MEAIYITMLTLLVGLSVAGLVVGVSNDAVNFLTSAFGSKAASLRTIFTVASVGVLIGAVFSTGMMEVPRNGIFNPEMYFFEEVMLIFLSVTLANIVLFDIFNSLGLPTSTSVAIVFELLGAAAFIAFIKNVDNGVSYSMVMEYLNTSKVLQIIVGILLSVVLAFSLGALIQYLSRLVFTFKYEQKIKYAGGIFGGISLTALSYFILIKGLSGLSFISKDFITSIGDNMLLVIGILLVFWSLVSQLVMTVFKRDILTVIILVGTFALALAFAGNDLVNFIGVPLAAKDSFDLWHSAFLDTGVAPNAFVMSGLNDEPSGASVIYLAIAGIIMVSTLWFSKKARIVIETGVNLSRQGEGKEKFEPNNFARLIVRKSLGAIEAVSSLLPKRMRVRISRKFETEEPLLQDKRIDAPAFDSVRASVNLVVSAILISVGTSYKLPLSTTYVTFMVAMGTSLSDRAWDRESAVYRVTGVLNVIGGWFATALIAFVGAAVFVAIMWFGGIVASVILSALAVFMMVRSAVMHSKTVKAEEKEQKFNQQDIVTINEITLKISDNISSVLKRINKRYGKVIEHLGYHDLAKLKNDTKKLEKIESRVEELNDNVFNFIRTLDEDSVAASKFYILFLDYLENMSSSIGEITRASYEHVHNNHKNLKFNQIRDLKQMDREMNLLFKETIEIFDTHSFENINQLIVKKSHLSEDISELIQKQIKRIRTTKSSRKNTKLYFGLLLDTKDLINSTIHLLKLFQDFYEEAKHKL